MNERAKLNWARNTLQVSVPGTPTSLCGLAMALLNEVESVAREQATSEMQLAYERSRLLTAIEVLTAAARKRKR